MNHLVKAIAALAAAVLLQAQSAAVETSPGRQAPFAQTLDQLVPELMNEFGARGVAVALIENGRVTTQRFYGYADAERRIPLGAGTRFNAASVSKSLTAVGVMTLVERGVIGIDDPLFSRVHRWQLPQSEFPAEGVTVSRVLSHTSGLSRWTTGIWDVNQRLPTLQAALSGDNHDQSDTRLVHRPGERWAYSGSGYSLMQLLVEETTGTPFPAFMTRQVLRPLGLSRSRIGWPEGGMADDVVSYDEFGSPLAAYRSVELGAGGWNTTIRDLATYAASFAAANDRNRRRALRPETIARMITPAPNGRVSATLQMGLGVYLETLPDGRTLIQHTGGNPGVGSLFAIDRASGNGIAILVNRSWGNQVYNPIYCAWQNATAPAGTAPRPCPRSAIGRIINTAATEGMEAGRRRYETLYAEAPDRLGESQMSTMASNFMGARRYADAATVLRWHLAHNAPSAEIQDNLGEALLAAGDSAGARTAWTEALRLEPGRPGVQQKLDALR